MDKVRFGVVGTNFISDWVIAGAREDPRFELVAVCSRTRERGEEFAARHAIPNVFTSLDEMASSPLRNNDGTPSDAAYREFIVNSDASFPLTFAHRICSYSLVWAKGLPSLPAGA